MLCSGADIVISAFVDALQMYLQLPRGTWLMITRRLNSKSPVGDDRSSTPYVKITVTASQQRRKNEKIVTRTSIVSILVITFTEPSRACLVPTCSQSDRMRLTPRARKPGSTESRRDAQI